MNAYVHSHKNLMLEFWIFKLHILKLHRKTILQQTLSSDTPMSGTPISFFPLLSMAVALENKNKNNNNYIKLSKALHHTQGEISKQVVDAVKMAEG